MSFEKLKLMAPILEAIKQGGYTIPTPIQEQAIPAILSGKDMIGCAQTGTGKTAAFAIPILQLLSKQHVDPRGGRKIRALILTPTRELAVQIGQKFHAYGKNLPLRYTLVYGGVSQVPQVRALQQGVDILVATPGRLLDLMNQRRLDLSNVNIMTLDEADRMLDMGFINDVKKILSKISPERQSLMFSATMRGEILKLAHTILKDPVRFEISPESPTAINVKQEIYLVDRSKKVELLVHLLQTKAKGSTLVFTRTKSGANRVEKALIAAGIAADAIHGNKSQGARQRALDTFKVKKTRVLVATDVASRGIDISALENVINFEIPNEPETYIHRIGRTGRAGLSGMAFSFCDWEEKKHVRNIMRLINSDIPVVDDHPFPAKMTGGGGGGSSRGSYSRGGSSGSYRPTRRPHRKGPSTRSYAGKSGEKKSPSAAIGAKHVSSSGEGAKKRFGENSGGRRFGGGAGKPFIRRRAR